MNLRSTFRSAAGKLVVRILTTSRIATIDGIHVADLRKDPRFESVVREALRLVRDHDPRRFSRIRAELAWIVNASLAGALGQYVLSIKACFLDFENSEASNELEIAALYAGVVVHEATHGLIFSKGFKYDPARRAQIERICRAEENRFLARLDQIEPGLGSRLQRPFEASAWADAWNTGQLLSLWRKIQRSREYGRSRRSRAGP